jgi:CRISPR-associated protein Cas2
MRLWVISYDVADDKRRDRLARLLARTMERVQESVFEGWLNSAEITRLIEEAKSILDLHEDGLRAYPLAVRTPERYQVYGQQTPTAEHRNFWIV